MSAAPYCFSPNPSEAEGTATCQCGSGRFAMDGFDRAIVPDKFSFSVSVLDSNGNLMKTFGSYGNSDDRGPQIRFLCMPYVQASRDCWWLVDQGLHRLLRVKWDYHAKASCGATM